MFDNAPLTHWLLCAFYITCCNILGRYVHTLVSVNDNATPDTTSYKHSPEVGVTDQWHMLQCLRCRHVHTLG